MGCGRTMSVSDVLEIGRTFCRSMIPIKGSSPSSFMSMAKRSIADFENGNLVREHFPFSWTQEHFSKDGKVYAVKPESLRGEDAVSYNFLKKWADQFTAAGRRIKCSSVTSFVAESSAKLKAYFGSSFIFVFNLFL